jgi:hypothetical protein
MYHIMLYTQGAQSQQFQQEQPQQFAAPGSSSALLTFVTDMQKPMLKQELEARGEVRYMHIYVTCYYV